MLPRKFRLTKRRDIVATIRQGVHLATPYAHIYYRGVNSPHARVTCIVSKKVSTLAVQRHKYQRWLRESARAAINKQNASCDMVWMAKPKITKLKNLKELKASLMPFLEKLCC